MIIENIKCGERVDNGGLVESRELSRENRSQKQKQRGGRTTNKRQVVGCW